MRTTVTLDEDVVQRVRAAVSRTRRPFKQVLNEALRAGLEGLEKPQSGKRYRTKPRPMRLREGLDLDNIQELLAQIEGEDAR